MKQNDVNNQITLEQLEERYEHLGIEDDFIFAKIMQDKLLCVRLLELLTGNTIDDVENIVVQKSVKVTNDSKGIRYDVYVDDGQNRIYDAEMQNKTSKDKELPRRSRFYQEMLDLNELEKGEHYMDLKDSYVIFICTYDPFKENLCCYSFSNVCAEKNNLLLDDGRNILFFNTKGDRENTTKEIAEFLDYVENRNVSGSFTQQLDDAVKKARKNKEWKVEYMKTSLHDMDVKREGFLEGREESIRILVETCKSLNQTYEYTVNRIMESYSLDFQESVNKVDLYWNK